MMEALSHSENGIGIGTNAIATAPEPNSNPNPIPNSDPNTNTKTKASSSTHIEPSSSSSSSSSSTLPRNGGRRNNSSNGNKEKENHDMDSDDSDAKDPESLINGSGSDPSPESILAAEKQIEAEAARLEAEAEAAAAATGPVSEEQSNKAEQLKELGNKFFADHHYEKAVDAYSRAIECDPRKAMYYANRAFAHIKMENYGAAIHDADKGIKLDATYIKSYYRRGAAHLALGKYKDGQQDFALVLKIVPNDKDAKAKHTECKKAAMAQAFAAAIEGEKVKPASETINIDDILLDPGYTGPRFEKEVTLEFITAMMDEFKAQRKIHKRYVYQIVLSVIKLLSATPTLMEIDVPEGSKFTVCGDVHGQYYDLLNIFALNGLPSIENPYLFNGDFVDRGSFSLEVILTLFSFKCLYPSSLFLTRGNHESKSMNSIYGFEGEVRAKVDTRCYELFTEAFCWLPLAACLGKRVLVVHGGLFSKDGVTLNQIKQVNRNMQPPEGGLMSELLWSDPQNSSGRLPSKRGVGLSFGPDVTKKFLAHNNLELLVRSHEVKEDGYEVSHDGKCITIFSAPNYCDQMGNKGAFINFGSDFKPKFTSYAAVPHPDVRPMAFASSVFGML